VADHDIRLVPEWKVAVAGKPLELLDDAELTKAVVDLDVDLCGQCRLTFRDPDLRLVDGTLFECGAPVKVTAGFGAKQQTIFEGEVVALEPKFRRDSCALEVVCLEPVHRLALQSSTRAFNAVDEHQIVTLIAQEHGLSADAPSGSQDHVLQANVSDALFLRRIAHNSGNHVRIDGKKLVVGPPPKGKPLTVGTGDGVKKIRVRFQAHGQVDEVAVHGWDPVKKQEFVGKAKAPPGTVGDGSRDHGSGASVAFAGHEHPPTDMATAEAMAQGRMRKLAEKFVVAEVEMIGNADLVPGTEVTFDKLGPKLDGKYRVESARHQFSKHGYFVSFHAVLVGKQVPAKVQTVETTFVEIALADSAGKPLPGERYRVTLADGSVREGILDGKGRARVSGLPKGQQVKVTFPEYDADSWKFGS
jgi:phage protein D/translation initiation factor IF-1